MKLSKSLKVVLVGVMAATGLAIGGVAITAGATSTTYYACLASTGTLSHVGTTKPTTSVCKAPSKIISWMEGLLRLTNAHVSSVKEPPSLHFKEGRSTYELPLNFSGSPFEAAERDRRPIRLRPSWRRSPCPPARPAACPP